MVMRMNLMEVINMVVVMMVVLEMARMMVCLRFSVRVVPDILPYIMGCHGQYQWVSAYLQESCQDSDNDDYIDSCDYDNGHRH